MVSLKPCWRDPGSGEWRASGGFPLQMRAIGGLFAEVRLVVIEVPPEAGGLPLPEDATVIPLRAPTGSDTRRKLSVARRLPEYLPTIATHVRWADVVHTPLPGDMPLLGFVTALALGRPVVA
ncbi:MAG: hypothetical protein KC656_29570, partial [Myxococcales bacterium]|nr:hypothetical protein [Myxococcales bacterium]